MSRGSLVFIHSPALSPVQRSPLKYGLYTSLHQEWYTAILDVKTGLDETWIQ